MNQAEVSAIVREVMEKWRDQINALGCPTEVGCVAGKRHFQEHADKWASDIEDFKNYIKDNNAENKETTSKLSAMTIMLHDAIGELGATLKQVGDLKVAFEKYDGKLWAIVMIILGLAVGTIWASYNVSASVKQINSVDIKNQTSTETYMAILVEQLSGKPIDAVVKEHMDKKTKIEKMTGGN